jgi:hypothetical protein
MKKLFILLSIIWVSNAHAGSQTGKVVDIRVSSKTVGGNPTHVMLEGGRDVQEGCGKDYWAIDTDTDLGKNILSVVLTAYSTGKSVTFWGTNQCDLRSDMETVFQAGLATD